MTPIRTDSELKATVMRELAWDTGVDETSIGVSADHGIVTLRGTAASWADMQAAEEATRRVAGVLDVANEIEIKPSWGRSDTDIAAAVRTAVESGRFAPISASGPRRE